MGRLAAGGLLVADNVLSRADELGPFLETAQAKLRVDAVLVPIGKGELLCRRTG